MAQSRKIQPNLNLYRLIYEHIKSKNELELKKLIASGIDIHMSFAGQEKLVREFAKQGNKDCVDFFVKLFDRRLSSAIIGYAEAGYDEYVNELLNKEKGLTGSAVYGYAKSGNVKKVEKLLLEDKGNASVAVQGYAAGGFCEEVNMLTKKNPECAITALIGYAASGNKYNVDKILEEYDNKIKVMQHNFNIGEYKYQFLNEALKSYIANGYVYEIEDLIKRGAYLKNANTHLKDYGYFKDSEALLELVSIMNDPNIRKSIVSEAMRVNQDINVSILVKADKINALMTKFSLNFSQACNGYQAINRGIFSNLPSVSRDDRAEQKSKLSFNG